MKARFSPAALGDLDDIWAFTVERWGVAQAERYIRAIRDALAAEVSGTRRGRACDEIRQGYFRLAVGSHALFYRLEGRDLAVVRILHGGMDFRRHL